MISLLQKRGAAITALNFEKMRQYDEELTALIHDDDQYDNITRPVCAFITFESDHYNEACAYEKAGMFRNPLKKEKKREVEIEVLGDTTPSFTAATEPTNIIWENRHIKGVRFGLRATSAIGIVILMLILTFIVILISKSKSI